MSSSELAAQVDVTRAALGSIPAGSCATVVGEASTSEELRACMIGGCCGKDTPLLGLDAVRSRMPALPRWALSADCKSISSSFVARDWSAALSFFNAVSVIAEEEGHHPDLHLESWREVRVGLSTHAIGGLSLPDLVIAAKIDAIPTVFSAKWLKSPEAAAFRPSPPPVPK
jgi:4a-hydroxytetrahydrobiopterin dehydratase